MNPSSSKGSNNVDELRYLFLASQVELLDAPNNLGELKYQFQSETLGVEVVKADGVTAIAVGITRLMSVSLKNMRRYAISATPSLKT